LELDRIQARIRPRRPMEAVDLGFALVGVWRGPLYRAWLAAAVPVMMALAVLGWRHPWIASLVLWWLKPLLDRVPLHVLSRALFGEIPGWRSTLREVPRLWTRGLARALVLQRLDFARSFTMPVDQLERLKGSARRRRLRVLGRRQKAEASRLTLICATAESALIYGGVTALAFLLPAWVIREPFDQFMSTLFSEEETTPIAWLGQVVLLSQMLAVLFLEPFYVAGGFCLYLNRRTQLEAWDVEMAFRRIGERLSQAARRAPTAVAVAAALLLPGLLQAGLALAQETTPVPFTSVSAPPALCSDRACVEAREAIAAVVADPVFGSTKRSWVLRARHQRSDASEPDPWLKRIGTAVGAMLEPVLWTCAVLCFVGYIVMRRPSWSTPGSLDPAGADIATVLGMDLRGGSLPRDVRGEALRLLEVGRPADAVGLLFRGALSRMSRRDRLPLHKGMTEGECVAMVRRLVDPGRANGFAALASAWTAAAYGHRPPDPAKIRILIDEWATLFGEPA
jgi:hypothetical protein